MPEDALMLAMDRFCNAVRLQKYRTIAQFAEQEIWLPPGGPRSGEKFELDAQPWVRHWFQLIDSGQYGRFALVKPGQVGGSLAGFNIPLMYHLFERRESTGVGVPDMTMAWDKWVDDIEPIIAASQYKDLIPSIGKGSKGGKFEAIQFKNGSTMKFMSAGGGDKKRAGKTLRALVVTEADGFDEAKETSREGDPISQMEARLNAFSLMARRVYLECTASIPKGRIWQEWLNGLSALLRLPCPACQSLVALEREHLKGWQQAPNEVMAFRNARFHCPICDHPWTEDERKEANRRAVLVCRGQEVTPDGRVVGSRPETITASLRVSAAQNMLLKAGDFGWKEWKAKFMPDAEENNLKSLYQFTWAMPWEFDANATGINEEVVASRLTGLPRGVLPEDTETLVAQIDLHTRWHYWTVVAASRMENPVWKEGAVSLDGKPIPRLLPPHHSVVDYGLMWTPDRVRLGPVEAIRAGLEELADRLETQQFLTSDGRIVPIDLILIDAGFHQEIGLAFVTGSSGPFRLIKGLGRRDRQGGGQKFVAPDKGDGVMPGDHWYDKRQPPTQESAGLDWWLLFSDTSYWMSQVHGGFLAQPYLNKEELDSLAQLRPVADPAINERNPFQRPEPVALRRPGSIALFGTEPEEHLRLVDAQVARSDYASQICAWIWSEAKTKKLGKRAATVVGWNSQWEQDHFLDTTYGGLAGESIVRQYARRFRPKPVFRPRTPPPATPYTTPGGQPYLLTNR
jgi:phage terminase large subunit GpA-like protein